MKKVIFAVLVTLSLGRGISYAQQFRAGVILGPDASDVVGLNPDGSNGFRKAGFTAGGMVNMNLSPQNSIQFEILYTEKGSLQSPDSINKFTEYKLNLDYIEVPIIFRHKFAFGNGKKMVDKLAYELGLSFGELVTVKQELFYNQSSYPQYTAVFDNSEFKKTEIALHIGGSYNITENLIFDVRFSNSIVPVIYHNASRSYFFWYSFNKGDNMVFSFTLRYLFGGANANAK